VISPGRIVVALAVLALAACAPDRGTQEREARVLVFEKLSQPDRAALVGPVVMQSDFAIVDWTRGRDGGRTLLRRGRDGWSMVLCGGAPLKRRPVLEQAGVPDGTAGVLVTKLLREEGRLRDGRREQIDLWRGARTDGVKVDCPEYRGP
jgi:hypothetical protein